MGRNWTRRSIEELIDDYLRRHAKVIPGPTPPVTGGLGAIHQRTVTTSALLIDAFNVKNTDNLGANYQQSIKPFTIPASITGDNDLDTNFGLSYPSSTFLVGYGNRSTIISEYNFYQQKQYVILQRQIAGTTQYFDLTYWYYYDSNDNIVYRLIRNGNYYMPFPASVLTGLPLISNNGFNYTDINNWPTDTYEGYVAYTRLNIQRLYNIASLSEISQLNQGYLIGGTIQLPDDFIKKYVQWFISNGTLPTAVQDLIIS